MLKIQTVVFRKYLYTHRAPAGFVISMDTTYGESHPFDNDDDADRFIRENIEQLSSDEFYVKQQVYINVSA